MNNKLTGKALNNVHKVVFLANEYSTKPMKEISSLVILPPADVNVAIWRAIDMGFLTVDNDDKVTIHEVPEVWELGEDVEYLKQTIVYLFKHLARDEMDLEENLFGHWTAGYATHDVMIAMKLLLADKVMSTYEITNAEIVKKGTKTREEVTRDSTYTFYTLWENNEQMFGRKQFKDQSKLK